MYADGFRNLPELRNIREKSAVPNFLEDEGSEKEEPMANLGPPHDLTTWPEVRPHGQDA